MHIPQLILCSSSPFRKRLLENMGVELKQVAPKTNELREFGENPRSLALRLGVSKAESVADRLQNKSYWICIGSDQVCHMAKTCFEKPKTFANAALQLKAFSNRWVTFSTSLALLSSQGQSFRAVEDYKCRFKSLSEAEIDRYIRLDNPLDCAGSIRAEKTGITLLKDAKGRDVNVLYGFPLILFSEALQGFSLDIKDFIKPS